METELALLPCADKLAFDTAKQAETAATKSKWDYGTELKVYKCKHCQLWHLASRTD